MLYLAFGNQRSEHIWLQSFRQHLPDLPVITAATLTQPEQIRWAAVWNPAPNVFRQFPNLEAVFALSAGVDALVKRADLPAHLPIMRLLDAGMAQQMSSYVHWVLLSLQGNFDLYCQRQQQLQWLPEPAPSLAKPSLGILGLGTLGSQVAQHFQQLGYPVAGWKRTPSTNNTLTTFAGAQGLQQLLARSQVLVNLLPDTPATQGILNADTLKQLPPGASLINLGRGQQLVEQDLLQLLDSNHLRWAVLDVFKQEPLPTNPKPHPFWLHPKITLTPHVAAYTLPEPAVLQVKTNLQRLAQGETPLGLVNRAQGY